MDAHLSFVIPALNEEAYISKAVDSIHEAMDGYHTQLLHEVIVVDDDSSDLTAAIARRHRARVLEVCKRNIAAVRNAGTKEARGELLVFVDADTQVNRRLVSEVVGAFFNLV